MEQMRLNKFLASYGICSRREADKLIEQGLVRVNGLPAQTGMTVSEKDSILVRGKAVSGKPKKVVLAYHKPVGVTCSEKDAHAAKLVTDQIHFSERVTYAGRLDKDSEGLLLMTNDGDLIDAMMRGSRKHEKEYVVKVKRPVTEEFIKHMSEGVYLKDLKVKTRPCQVVPMGPNTFSIILTQGLNRQIRRMCKECGNEVSKLKRVRVMNVLLGDLKSGEYRQLAGQELVLLYRLAGMEPPEE